MSWRRTLLTAMNIPLNRLGLHLLPSYEYQQIRSTYDGPEWQKPPVSEADRAHLTLSNPRLQELRARYDGHPASSHTQWQEAHLLDRLDLANFRADNHYVYQTRYSPPPETYYLTALYARDTDALGLFNRLTEDGMFGAYTLPFENGYKISRDLLDSINEINFIHRMLNIDSHERFRLLDIGAGYGRLAYRFAESPLGAEVTCTDAVPVSTFLCEFYLRFRGVADKARVIPLHQIEQTLCTEHFDVITNIHSFSECPLSAIEWWFQAIDKSDVVNLMIVPNASDQLLSTEGDGTHQPFLPLVEKYGWRLVHTEPIYAHWEVAQKHALYPNFRFWWFERGAADF